MSNRTARSGANYAHKTAPDCGPAISNFLIGDAGVKMQLLVMIQLLAAGLVLAQIRGWNATGTDGIRLLPLF